MTRRKRLAAVEAERDRLLADVSLLARALADATGGPPIPRAADSEDPDAPVCAVVPIRRSQ